MVRAVCTEILGHAGGLPSKQNKNVSIYIFHIYAYMQIFTWIPPMDF